MMQAADVLVLVAVAAHTAVHVPILNNPMRPRLWTAQRRESTA
ncbi:c-di-GMP-binding flagellar brake protein YcgR [Salinibacter ruber]|jgi:c-di-GMP-binding flagellar brake protein YcgR|nr:c-di-GMP-binding flagellar brake protein YcgR [Salinibacter ruber]